MKSILRALIVAFLFCIVSMSIVYAEEEDLSYLEKVVVEKGIDTVTITLPPEMITEGEMWEGSIPPVMMNDGGEMLHLTYSEYDELLSVMREGLKEGLQDMVADESFGYVSIEVNDDFTDYIITIDGEEMSFAGIFGVYGLLIYSGIYSVYNGEDLGTITFSVVDNNTGLEVASFTDTDLAEVSFE